MVSGYVLHLVPFDVRFRLFRLCFVSESVCSIVWYLKCPVGNTFRKVQKRVFHTLRGLLRGRHRSFRIRAAATIESPVPNGKDQSLWDVQPRAKFLFPHTL